MSQTKRSYPERATVAFSAEIVLLLYNSITKNIIYLIILILYQKIVEISELNRINCHSFNSCNN